MNNHYCNLLNCYKSLVLCDIHGNELHQVDLITGAPHGVNPSLLNFVGCVSIHEEDYILLSFIKEKLYSVNHWFCMI